MIWVTKTLRLLLLRPFGHNLEHDSGPTSHKACPPLVYSIWVLKRLQIQTCYNPCFSQQHPNEKAIVPCSFIWEGRGGCCNFTVVQ